MQMQICVRSTHASKGSGHCVRTGVLRLCLQLWSLVFADLCYDKLVWKLRNLFARWLSNICFFSFDPIFYVLKTQCTQLFLRGENDESFCFSLTVFYFLIFRKLLSDLFCNISCLGVDVTVGKFSLKRQQIRVSVVLFGSTFSAVRCRYKMKRRLCRQPIVFPQGLCIQMLQYLVRFLTTEIVLVAQ